jgi:beta-xylosidase
MTQEFRTRCATRAPIALNRHLYLDLATTMNKYCCPLSLFLLFGCLPLLRHPASAQQPTAFTSFKPGTVWLADNGIHIDCHGGNILYHSQSKTFYWYGEHRGSPAGVACYASVDLYNWKYLGLAMPKGTIAVLERPKVAFNATTGKYVMWFHYDNSGYALAHLGVAVSDSARGPFTLVNHFTPNGHQSRDIGMFRDDDGKVYVIYAADQTNVTIRIVELSADYLDVTANDSDISAHCEGPGMLKKNGTYYLATSLCSGWSPNQASYYTAAKIMGPYTRKGDPCINDTAHTTFNSQPCFIFQIPGYADGYLYMGDRWNGGGSANSQYVFLPITITAAGAMQIRWLSEWNLGGVFAPAAVHGLRNPAWGNSAGFGPDAVYDIRGKKSTTVGGRSPSALRSGKSAGLRVAVRKNGVVKPVFSIP